MMTDNIQTKTCPACAEVIKAAAKVCPHCRTKQVRFALWRQEAAGAFVALLLLVLFFGGIAWIAPDDSLDGRSFAGHQRELVVGGLTLERGVKMGEYRLAGTVTNTGGYPWRVFEIEVKFRASDGQVMDVQQVTPNQAFVVQPGGKGAFTDSLWRAHPDALTARLEARIVVATDGNKPPPD